MQDQIGDVMAFAREVKDEGVRHVVLLGMGGSSLAPEVFQRTFGNQAGYPELVVLDSTHPGAVRAVEKRINLSTTLFLVSSKSGTTTETVSFFRYFWHKVKLLEGERGKRFVAITDPGTPLDKLASDLSFRRVFHAPPDVGGRYSALSVFGLLPAALIGVDIRGVLDRARRMAEAWAFCVSEKDNPALALGAALGELALSGRDKVTFFASPCLTGFAPWIEQLIAESTGKDGKGIVPVVDEAAGPPEIYGADRVFVYLEMDGDKDEELAGKVAALETVGHPLARIRLSEKIEVGREFFRWEVAMAGAGAVLRIHPFDQPDVELAKELASRAMAEANRGAGEQRRRGAQQIAASEEKKLREVMSAWLATARPGDYIALQAYLNPTHDTMVALESIRVALRNRLSLATTLGYGPRFLHSTGQLHKGGPKKALILQLVDELGENLEVPETDYSFGSLIHAQALGDYQALERRGQRLLRVNLGRDVRSGLLHLYCQL